MKTGWENYKILRNCIDLNELKNFRELSVVSKYGRLLKVITSPTVKEILNEVDSMHQDIEKGITDYDSYSIRLCGKASHKDAKIYRNSNHELVLHYCYR